MRLIPEGFYIDFMGKRNLFASASAIAVVLSIVAFFVKGPNWGIDFTGGTEIIVEFADAVPIEEVRGGVEKLGIGADSVQEVGAADEHRFNIRVREVTFGVDDMAKDIEARLKEKLGPNAITSSELDVRVGARLLVRHPPELRTEAFAQALADFEGIEVRSHTEADTVQIKFTDMSGEVAKLLHSGLGEREFKVLSVESVGPKVGSDLRNQAIVSLSATLVLILVYVAFRFELAFAPGAVLALFHDVLVTVGVFVVLQWEVNVSFIGALLTIVGYSMNDTVVIYDRVRENLRKYRRTDLVKLVNDSMNQTIGRTLATSWTTALAIIPFLIWGGDVIRSFALAMTIGIIAGTYSTIFVAAPAVLVMDKLVPKIIAFLTPATTGVPTEEEGEAEREHPQP